MVSETRSDDAEEIGRKAADPWAFHPIGSAIGSDPFRALNLILRRRRSRQRHRLTEAGQQGGSNEREKHTGFDTADITALSHLYRGDRSTVRRNLRERVTSGLT